MTIRHKLLRWHCSSQKTHTCHCQRPTPAGSPNQKREHPPYHRRLQFLPRSDGRGFQMDRLPSTRPNRIPTRHSFRAIRPEDCHLRQGPRNGATAFGASVRAFPTIEMASITKPRSTATDPGPSHPRANFPMLCALRARTSARGGPARTGTSMNSSIAVEVPRTCLRTKWDRLAQSGPVCALFVPSRSRTVEGGIGGRS